jgi:hypothetical protein
LPRSSSCFASRRRRRRRLRFSTVEQASPRTVQVQTIMMLYIVIDCWGGSSRAAWSRCLVRPDASRSSRSQDVAFGSLPNYRVRDLLGEANDDPLFVAFVPSTTLQTTIKRIHNGPSIVLSM